MHTAPLMEAVRSDASGADSSTTPRRLLRRAADGEIAERLDSSSVGAVTAREPRAPVAAADAPETESVEQSQKAEQQSEDLSNVEPFVQFNCSICGLSEKCFFGDLKALDGFYPSPVFYMRDPFLPPRRVKGRKLQLSDFLVLGSSCSLCSQSVCLDKACSVYFGTLFCTTCIIRERRRFPETVLQMVAKSQSASKP